MKVSNSTLTSLVQRYSHKDGKIYFDDYIHCVARLRTMFGEFSTHADNDAGAMSQYLHSAGAVVRELKGTHSEVCPHGKMLFILCSTA